MTSPQADKTQIGLTSAGSAALALIMGQDLFTTESDAYKLGIAFALGQGYAFDAAPTGGYQTKFNAAGGLDRDGTVRDLVAQLMPEGADRPYATAERLAELGLIALAGRLGNHESLADILTSKADYATGAGVGQP